MKMSIIDSMYEGDTDCENGGKAKEETHLQI